MERKKLQLLHSGLNLQQVEPRSILGSSANYTNPIEQHKQLVTVHLKQEKQQKTRINQDYNKEK